MSTYDRRYPWMEPLERAAPPSHRVPDLRGLRRACAGVASRTGTRAFYNARDNSVLFVYGAEPCGGPLALPAAGRYADHDVDEVVRIIQMGKVGRRAKARVAARNAQLEGWERERAMDSHLAERRPDALSYAAFRDRERRGTHRVIGVP